MLWQLGQFWTININNNCLVCPGRSEWRLSLCRSGHSLENNQEHSTVKLSKWEPKKSILFITKESTQYNQHLNQNLKPLVIWPMLWIDYSSPKYYFCSSSTLTIKAKYWCRLVKKFNCVLWRSRWVYVFGHC